MGSVREPAFAVLRQDRRAGLEALVVNSSSGRDPGSLHYEPFALEVLLPDLPVEQRPEP
jgi:hypothetical protein